MAQLKQNALTTLDTVKTELGIEDSTLDNWVIRKINIYSDMFEQATDCEWYFQPGDPDDDDDEDTGFITPKQEADGMGERTLAYDIEDAVVSAIETEYFKRSRDPNIKSIKVGEGTTTWATGEEGSGQGSTAFKSAVKRYRKVTFI